MSSPQTTLDAPPGGGGPSKAVGEDQRLQGSMIGSSKRNACGAHRSGPPTYVTVGNVNGRVPHTSLERVQSGT
jgi:hypothetical protein